MDMHEVFFTPPSGQKAQVSSVDQLKQLILQPEEKYWASGRGQGGLEKALGKEAALLILQFHSKHGFLLQYCHEDPTDFLVTKSGDDYTQTTQVSMGGEPWTVPVAFFVEPPKAWAAVEDFARSGKPCSSLMWVRLSDQEWESGY